VRYLVECTECVRLCRSEDDHRTIDHSEIIPHTYPPNVDLTRNFQLCMRVCEWGHPVQGYHCNQYLIRFHPQAVPMVAHSKRPTVEFRNRSMRGSSVFNNYRSAGHVGQLVVLYV
jgi:hypothetical protein